jgi:hypothetical protein
VKTSFTPLFELTKASPSNESTFPVMLPRLITLEDEASSVAVQAIALALVAKPAASALTVSARWIKPHFR